MVNQSVIKAVAVLILNQSFIQLEKPVNIQWQRIIRECEIKLVSVLKLTSGNL